MPIPLRVILFLGAVSTFSYFIKQIRHNRMQIPVTIFWSFFSSGLILISVFPSIVVWLSVRLGFQSPANFLFTLIIFILVLKSFDDTIKITNLREKITVLTQHIALIDKKSHPE